MIDFARFADDRRRGRRAAHGRHGAHRRAGGGRASIPSPVPHADFVTTTTHKTLRGPRGGIILCKEEYAKEIDKAVFPGMQGGPLMHVIAAKAVAFGEALQPEFKRLPAQVVANAKALADGAAASAASGSSPAAPTTT